MRSWMVIFVLFCCALLTSGQGNVSFASKNFFNILKWNPAEPRFPGEQVRYSVLYSDPNLEEFHPKAQCQNITELFCDLTNETRPVYDVHYVAKVLVGDSDYGQTRRFKPVAETVLGAPILSHHIGRTSLRVNVELPLGPNNESFADIFRKIKKGPSEDITVYNLIIAKPDATKLEIESTSGHFVVDLKDDQREYCGYVVYKPALEWGRPLSEKASFCVTRPDHSWMPWTILSVVVLVAVLLSAAYCAIRYVTEGKKTWPHALETPQQWNNSCKVIMDPMDDCNISKPEISTRNENAKIICHLASVSSAVDGGYGHSHVLPWSENSSLGIVGIPSPALHYQDESAESSVIYGGVAAAEENGDFHQLQTEQAKENSQWMSRSNGVVESGPLLSSLKKIQLSNLEGYENNEAQPLLLQTQRDRDGLLTLPMLSLVQQPFSGTTDTLISLERKPLLSYLTVSSEKGSNFVSLHSLNSSDCSDFGTDENTLPTPTQDYSSSHYLPTQPDFTHFSPDSQSPLSCDSGTYDTPYKQNWMPHSWNL